MTTIVDLPFPPSVNAMYANRRGGGKRRSTKYVGRLHEADIGVSSPTASPSKYEFDSFDPSVVDVWILNDGLSLGMSTDEARIDLEAKVSKAAETIVRKLHA
jgi:hypothetical protein